MVELSKYTRFNSNVFRSFFAKRITVICLFTLATLYSYNAVKEQRWNFFVPEQSLFAQAIPLSLSSYGNVCISNLILNTKRTHENTSCMKLDLFQNILKINPTIRPENLNRVLLNVLAVKVQKRFTKLQNPADCSKAKILVCWVEAGHGFGSLMHLLGECFLIALGTGRTMVLELTDMWYGNLDIFKPVASENCASRSLSNARQWKDQTVNELEDVDVVKVKIFFHKNPKFVPFLMPPSIAEPLQCCHGDPNAWWMGQIIKYFVRPQPWVEMEIINVKERIGFSHPIVGLHIRRTDKKSEAKYQHLESYMSHAIKWYDCNYARKGVNVTKKIYLATDDPNVIAEAEAKYPDFVFLHDPYINQHSTVWWNRFSKHGVLGVATDLMLLKESDFFIGTYSSNLGRLVYELRQAEDEKIHNSLSLDSGYYYHRDYPIWHLAVENHEPLDDEMRLQIGDKIFTDPGRSSLVIGIGKNERTGVFGKYPISKVRPYVSTTYYPGFT